MATRNLNDREINTILCALHGMYAAAEPRACSPRTCDHFDEADALTKEEMHRLASQLWLDGVRITYNPEAADEVFDGYRGE